MINLSILPYETIQIDEWICENIYSGREYETDQSNCGYSLFLFYGSNYYRVRKFDNIRDIRLAIMDLRTGVSLEDVYEKEYL